MDNNKKIANASNKKNAASFNLSSSLMKKLSGMKIKEISPMQEKKDFIYIYPENWGKNEISGLIGKNHRGGLRRKLMNLISLIILFASKKRIEDLQEKIKEFNDFYKKNYRINDYSISSISQKINEEDLKNISIAMEIIKESGILISGNASKSPKSSNKKNPASKKRNASKSPKKEIASNEGILIEEIKENKDESPISE